MRTSTSSTTSYGRCAALIASRPTSARPAPASPSRSHSRKGMVRSLRASMKFELDRRLQRANAGPKPRTLFACLLLPLAARDLFFNFSLTDLLSFSSLLPPTKTNSAPSPPSLPPPTPPRPQTQTQPHLPLPLPELPQPPPRRSPPTTSSRLSTSMAPPPSPVVPLSCPSS